MNTLPLENLGLGSRFVGYQGNKNVSPLTCARGPTMVELSLLTDEALFGLAFDSVSAKQHGWAWAFAKEGKTPCEFK